MPRKIQLAWDQARDVDGIIHKARDVNGRGLYYVAECNGEATGKGPDRLRGYCHVCYPEKIKQVTVNYNANLPSLDLDGGYDPGNLEGAKQIIRDQFNVEAVLVPSRELPETKRKPKSDKTLDQILRKDSIGFVRRKLR